MPQFEPQHRGSGHAVPRAGGAQGLLRASPALRVNGVPPQIYAITERYAHLAPGFFGPGVHSALAVSLQRGSQNVAQISAEPAPAATPSTPH